MKTNIFLYNNIEYTIYVGQNKTENWELIDAAEQRDIWFHIENMASCHVVLQNVEKVKLRDIPKQVIKRCAYLCKINSSVLVKTMSKCNVIYTPISEVVKTDIVGQVSVTNYKTVSNL
jgi:predicted ribosome quality control (RQC) complex YloA/Tae2 family protein